jgi:N-methylhydantoinase B/oxoprolinase/acetone carboxylase alpha subunit
LIYRYPDPNENAAWQRRLELVVAALVDERRLKEFCQKYGRTTVKQFITAWLDYSEQSMVKRVWGARIILRILDQRPSKSWGARSDLWCGH